MKIAIIIYRYYPFIGGAEVFAQEVAEYLAKNECTVDVITMCPDRSLNESEVINGVNVHRIVTGRINSISFIIAHFRLLLYILKLENARNYDLVHIVGDSLTSVVGTIVKKLRRKPIIITIQGGSFGAGFKNNLKDRILILLHRWCFKNANLIHVISRKLLRQVKELGANDVVVIPNGIDAKIFKPMNKEELKIKFGYSQDELIIISVARLISRKGIYYLIRAISIVSEYLPNVRLIIVGDGEQHAELNNLIKQLKLEDKAKILGFIPHDQIPQYLNLADIFVIPSLYEPLGIVTIEAMGCGVPVIGTNVDGILDVIDHGKNGILVPPANEKVLAEEIMRLIQNKTLKDKFTEEGFKKVKEQFLWETILQQIEQIYINLVQNKI